MQASSILFKTLDRFYQPVALEREVKAKPLQVCFGDQNIVLYRDASSQINALSDFCPHRGAKLSTGKVDPNGYLRCPYHGWAFDNNGHAHHPTDGKIKNCKARAFFVRIQKGVIFIATNESAVYPDEDLKDAIHIGSYHFKMNVPFPIAVDNFNEDEHFPFVHKVLGWDEEGAKKVQFSHLVTDDQVQVQYLGPQREFFGMRMLMTRPGDYFRNHWRVEFRPLRITYEAFPADSTGKRTGPIEQFVRIYFTPVSLNQTQLTVIQYQKTDSKFFKSIARLGAPLVKKLTEWDLHFDKKFLEKNSDLPVHFYSELGRLRLGKFDAPLVNARRMMERIYFQAKLEQIWPLPSHGKFPEFSEESSSPSPRHDNVALRAPMFDETPSQTTS